MGHGLTQHGNPPKGARFYNITIVPKVNPQTNETYSTTGEV